MRNFRMAKQNILISKVIVRKLFGLYDYDLIPQGSGEKNKKIFILYGDNGSGKTTILRLIYHIINSEDRAGHKSFVAGTKFRSFEIYFDKGIKISVSRDNDKIIGSFNMEVINPIDDDFDYYFEANEENVVKSSKDDLDQSYSSFLIKLKDLSISLYLLSDDRSIQIYSSSEDRRIINDSWIEEEVIFRESLTDLKRRKEKMVAPERLQQVLLVDSIHRLEQWIRNQVMSASTKGESSVNSLYQDILSRIVAKPLQEGTDIESSRNELIKKLESIEKEGKKYSLYGFIPNFKSKDLIENIRNAPSSHLSLIMNMLNPYLNSMEAKFNALNNIQKTTDSLLKVFNKFLSTKSIKFNIRKRLQIYSGDGDKLDPNVLSSGERHLFLLFCNTITALGQPSIFIIDEPEISLNIKWQRKLISSLLECVGENPVQYIFATHSFEILSQYKHRVAKLDQI